MDDLRFRHEIYRSFAGTGRAPRPDQLEAWAGGADESRAALGRLHAAHAVVLDEDGEIRMALPFSAVPTGHVVTSGARRWWANCAWDALAIPATLGIDAEIDATWLDTGRPVGLAVVDGEPTTTDGFVHVQIPARRWWEDIVET